MRITHVLYGSLLIISALYAGQVADRGDFLELTTRYGTTLISEPILIELIKSPAMERLKNIHQYGVTRYAHAEKEYTRYQHSLGVLHLLRLFGAPLEEQIDGLLHDVSHTVFSHVGDYVFNHRNKKTSYQDEIHEWFLEEVGITAILKNYGFADCCSKESKKRHCCLEQDKPNLCADRIEYNLSGGLLDGFLTGADVQAILKSLRFEHNQWFFTDPVLAKRFAQCSLQLSRTRWGAVWNQYVDYCACQALLRAVEVKAVTHHMIHFSDDQTVWDLLQSCNDAEINQWLSRIIQCEQGYCRRMPMRMISVCRVNSQALIRWLQRQVARCV